jgi:hypothetical protein
MKIKIFLTFDHELPLGGVRTSYENAMFEPTYKVLDIADKYGIKTTLFSDILCAYRYREWDKSNYYLPYVKQVRYAIRNRHDVQLHIHPHWLTSGYDGKGFIPSADFMLSDFRDNAEYGGISGIIELSVEKLSDICTEADGEYKCLAYRAGGYNIHPETELIFDSLYKNGILYDSSMAKGYYFRSGISEVDFRNLPSAANWIINPADYHIELTNQKGILEIPIATIPKTPFEMPTRFKLGKYAYRAVENRGRFIHQDNKTDFGSKLKMLFSSRMLSFDNHTLSLKYLLQMVDYNIRKHKDKKKELLFSVVSHPKSMGNYSLELMEGFISSIQKDYPDIEFTTFTNYHRQQNESE